MKRNTMLTVASLLSLLFLTLHITDDIVRGISKAESLKHCAARPRGLTVRDTRAPRTAIGARHHAAHRIVRGSHARHAHEGGTLRRDRQIPRRLFLRLDTLGARRAGGLHPDPLSARTVGSATEPAPVVQGNGRWRCSRPLREVLAATLESMGRVSERRAEARRQSGSFGPTWRRASPAHLSGYFLDTTLAS